jgi:hypothetical protein
MIDLSRNKRLGFLLVFDFLRRRDLRFLAGLMRIFESWFNWIFDALLVVVFHVLLVLLE